LIDDIFITTQRVADVWLRRQDMRPPVRLPMLLRFADCVCHVADRATGLHRAAAALALLYRDVIQH
jgi:hypothetical protein